MRVVVAGLGVQGRKRVSVAGDDLVATVDPVAGEATYRDLTDLPPDGYDAVLVCTPDDAKLGLLETALGLGKHVLVEKPLLATEAGAFDRLSELAHHNAAACYTAYNHRFEPALVRLRALLSERELGDAYCARFFYGNGTARDVRGSPWRDRGAGVITDLGSHLLDLARFLLGPAKFEVATWAVHRFENESPDHAMFGAEGDVALAFETSLVSWRNAFAVDVYGSKGSAHVDSLCKWGPSTLTWRRRVLPSGRPPERIEQFAGEDPTWAAEYQHFLAMCEHGGTTLDNDRWINETLGLLGTG